MADTDTLNGAGIKRNKLRRSIPIIDSNPIDSAFEQNVRNTLTELGDLLIKKHKDYGPKNISNSPYGVIRGLITRMWDKMARMVNLTKGDNITAENEPLEDSFKDMANYSVIALMELRGQWPKE